VSVVDGPPVQQGPLPSWRHRLELGAEEPHSQTDDEGRGGEEERVLVKRAGGGSSREWDAVGDEPRASVPLERRGKWRLYQPHPLLIATLSSETTLSPSVPSRYTAVSNVGEPRPTESTGRSERGSVGDSSPPIPGTSRRLARADRLVPIGATFPSVVMRCERSVTSTRFRRPLRSSNSVRVTTHPDAQSILRYST
jgi:hypothetical protein